jgi:hypothetical protein
MMSGFLYKTFEMDADLEREGITVNYGSVKFVIARAGGRNKDFKTYFTSQTRKFRSQLENETMSDDVAENIMADAYARYIILGWFTRKEDENGDPILDKSGQEQWDDVIENKAGKRVKFSVDECVKVLKDLPDLFSDLQRMASKSANYRKEEEAEDVGNLLVS